MAKNKKKRKKDKINKRNKPTIKLKINTFIVWLATIGVLPIILSFIHGLVTGDVEIEYQKSIGRGYEFKLTNNSPTDQIIEEFRIVPDLSQKFVYTITENVYAKINEKGVSLPGGNTSYIPAYEYNGLDGQKLSAKSAIAFRIPPLSSRPYMLPDAMVVFIQYKTKSKNIILNKFENLLDYLNIQKREHKKKFLVIENYWTPMGNNDKTTAIQAACRDNDLFSKSSICNEFK